MNKTVILVSHDMDAINRFCNRSALLSNGKLDLVGPSKQVAELYGKYNAKEVKLFSEEATIKSGAQIQAIRIKDFKPKGYDVKDSIALDIEISTDRDIKILAGIQIVKE